MEPVKSRAELVAEIEELIARLRADMENLRTFNAQSHRLSEETAKYLARLPEQGQKPDALPGGDKGGRRR
jgi:hypothetical protein